MSRSLFTVAFLIVFLLPKLAMADDLLIIANPSVSSPATLTLSQIEAIYLLKTTVWPDGSHVVPVNREVTSELRAQFTTSVMRQDMASLAAYWNEMHFMGKQPPVVQESERAMLAFIQKVPGSIGYINASTQPINVKVLAHVP